MKKILLAFAFVGCMFAANAQEKPSTGDLFDGLTRPLTFDRMIPPYALEVTFDKTVHVIFPSAIRYVDLGSADLLAAKADGTENVLRVRPHCGISRARATSRSLPRTGHTTRSMSSMPTSR